MELSPQVYCKVDFVHFLESRSERKYDIIIPLDHVKPENSGKIPDFRGGNSYVSSRATGADGRERDHQDKAAKIIKSKLEKRGVKVKIITPEEFGNYEDYDEFIASESRKGTKVIPLHFDAKVGQGGVGFLTRIRPGDAGDRMLAGSISDSLRVFQEKHPELGNFRNTDTVPNQTMNASAPGPATLVEMGAMVQWEEHYGNDFTNTKEFNEFADTLVRGIVKGGGYPKVSLPPGWPKT